MVKTTFSYPIMSKDLVVKTNRLNQAFQVLTLAELHIVQLAIVDARETGTGLSTDKPLRIDAMRYAEAFGTSRQNAYKRMKEAEDTLFNRRFSFYDEDGKLVKSRWIQQVKYLDDEGAIELAFTMAVVHGISRIDGVKEFFTQYLLSQTAKLSSVYSARLYELLVQWKSIGKTPVFELANFRDQLGIGVNEYQRMDHFKTRIIDMALKEINEQTDITASYEQHKKGRVITGFSFKFKQKPKQAQIATEAPKRDQTEEQPLKPLTEPQIAKYSAILCKLGSLSDLSNFPDYPTFANWLGNMLRSPENGNQETVKRVFKALRTETDYQ